MKLCPHCNKRYADAVSICPACWKPVQILKQSENNNEEWRALVVETFLKYAVTIPTEDSFVREHYGSIFSKLSCPEAEALNREVIIVKMYVVKMLCQETKIPTMIIEAFLCAVYASVPLLNKKYSLQQYDQLLQQRAKEYDGYLVNINTFDEKKSNTVFEQFTWAGFNNAFGRKPSTQEEVVLATLFALNYSSVYTNCERSIKEWKIKGMLPT